MGDPYDRVSRSSKEKALSMNTINEMRRVKDIAEWQSIGTSRLRKALRRVTGASVFKQSWKIPMHLRAEVTEISETVLWAELHSMLMWMFGPNRPINDAMYELRLSAAARLFALEARN